MEETNVCLGGYKVPGKILTTLSGTNRDLRF
jgi:hypothetical protein